MGRRKTGAVVVVLALGEEEEGITGSQGMSMVVVAAMLLPPLAPMLFPCPHCELPWAPLRGVGVSSHWAPSF